MAEACFNLIIGQDRLSITVFECKCLIMQAFGMNVPVKEIGQLLERKCNWKKSGTGVHLDEFKMLYNSIRVRWNNDASNSDCYNEFDVRNKGWITEDDVFRVFVSVAPKLAHRHVHEIFAAADVHGVEQVTHRSYSSTVAQLQQEQNRNTRTT